MKLLLLTTGLSLLTPAAPRVQEEEHRNLRWFGIGDGSNGRRRCRKGGEGPHMEGLFQANFPDSGLNKPVPLCEGSVTMGSDFSICTTGRVSYDQIAAVAAENGRYIFAPAAGDITVPGHIISGSSNAVLGSEAALIQGFIANYTIGGVTTTADATMTDNLFAASRGTLSGVCFLPSFSQEESFYTIKHDFWSPKSSKIDFTRAVNANILYFGYFSAVAEYHTRGDAPVITGHVQLALISFVASIVPSFAFNLVPFLGFTGIFRLFTTGTMSTAKFPQPLDAPPVIVEDTMINTEWTTLIAAAEAGLFTDGAAKVPLYFGVFIKRVQPTANACWDVETASIDFQAPKGAGEKLDAYINDHVLPGKFITF